MDTKESKGAQNQDQDEFRVSDRAAHDEKYPFIQEFSEFLASVSTDSLKYKLLTNQQRTFAEAVWAAENYGGDNRKCEKRLEEFYGLDWRSMTKIDDHMAPKRDYYEYVLLIEHQRQWENSKNRLT